MSYPTHKPRDITPITWLIAWLSLLLLGFTPASQAAPDLVISNVSTDNQIDSSDLSLGLRNLSTLAARVSSSASTKFTIPKTTPPGVFPWGHRLS